MIKIFQKAFKITNENIILTTPLVLFLLILFVYMVISQNAPSNWIAALLKLITILFMISAFFAGWFNMVKKAIALDKQEFIIDEDKVKASFNLIKDLPVGIGEYFFPMMGQVILSGLLFMVMIVVGFKLGMHFIGDAGLTFESVKAGTASHSAMRAMVSSLTTEQLSKLAAWDFLFLIGSGLYCFLTMFWGAEIVNRTKNPFLAFFRANKLTFSNFLSALILFIYISFVYNVVSVVSSVAQVNIILHFLSLLIYFYFVVYVVVLIFLYYDKETSGRFSTESVQGECSQDNCVAGDGQCDCAGGDCSSGNSRPAETEGDSDSGSDGVGQDESGDSSGKDS